MFFFAQKLDSLVASQNTHDQKLDSLKTQLQTANAQTAKNLGTQISSYIDASLRTAINETLVKAVEEVRCVIFSFLVRSS